MTAAGFTAASRQGDALQPRLQNPARPGTTRESPASPSASILCRRSSYKLPGDRDRHPEWHKGADRDFATVNSYAPNFRASVVSRSAQNPWTSNKKIGLAA